MRETLTSAPDWLPSFDDVLAEVAAAEQRDGWLVECEQRGCYLALNRPLIAALVSTLRSLGDAPVLELCAGDGRLAAALVAASVPVIATDAAPRGDRGVHGISAVDALAQHQPAVVLGSFVPLDSGIDDAVRGADSVRHYLVLNARIGGVLGASSLWDTALWRAERLDHVTPWMITRHDVWLDDPAHTLIQHGEAWLLHRVG